MWFYTNRNLLILNGRYNNLEYGSFAPGAPDVFIDDARMKTLWRAPTRYYLVAEVGQVPRFTDLLGTEQFNLVARAGGKVLLTNQPLSDASPSRQQ